MTCRETSAGSAFTSYARYAANNGYGSGVPLSDPAVLSCFHEAIRQYNDYDEVTRPTYTREEYLIILGGLESNLESSFRTRFLSDARRRSIQARLARARTEPMPDNATINALTRIQSLTSRRSSAIRYYLNSVSNRTGLPYDELLRRFQEYEGSVSRSRGARSGYLTPSARSLAERINMGNDVGLIYAASRIEEEANAIEIAQFRRAPQRIQQLVEVATPRVRPVGDDFTAQVHRMGYDPRVGRLEIEISDSQTGEIQSYAYCNVSEEAWDTLSSPGNDATAIWRNTIRGNSEHQYENEVEAARHGVAPRCRTCGRFADATHSCPFQAEPTLLTTYSTSSRWSRQSIDATLPTGSYNDDGTYTMYETTEEFNVRLPAIREFRSRVEASPIRVDIPAFSTRVVQEVPDSTEPNGFRLRSGSVTVRGSFTAWKDPETGEIRVDGAGLQCGCNEYKENYTCPHVRIVTQAATARLVPESRPRTVGGTPVRRGRLTAEQRLEVLREAQVRSEAVAAESDWMLDENARTQVEQLWAENSEVSYAQDFESFYTRYLTASEDIAAKSANEAIPYIRENAFGGLAQRGSGKAFGMEIEFDIEPGRNKGAAIAAIAQELHAEGLTWSPNQERYQASQARGFRDTHADENGVGNWTLERDGSVDGELVTPAMYDEPETWEKLEKAVQIIRKHGGIPSKRAGAHVHVGTGEYSGDPGKYTALANLVNQHEDIIYRLSSDPIRQKHRNNGYSNPLPPVPGNGFGEVTEVRRWQRSRYTAVNFQSVRGGQEDHPEFRVFDSTLNVGAMQAQAKLAVALTSAAERTPRVLGGGEKLSVREPLGAHAKRADARGTRMALTKDEIEADTRTFRSLLDTLFTRKEDKDQFIALFASTKWNKATRRRGH